MVSPHEECPFDTYICILGCMYLVSTICMMWAVYEKVDGFAAVRVLGAGLP